ncbi:hypothetical protein GCM10010317_076520 [Streptomyces mirabilis]|uniref:DUF6221 family protein n=1 Tax=Streptomyces mirabilis TaxID=68239 RepID=UPI00167DC1C0|nr:DUF6221 family protein [Streptomyces mirabilis]GHD70055.1 hypothetical protein GCM10010317_076520 [Streptomyces mirabilis]
MDDLVQWLSAQLDEDERIAKEAGVRSLEWRLARPLDDEELGDASWLRPPELKHAELHDPARVLAEIAIDRQLLSEYERLLRAHASHEAEAKRMAEESDDDPFRRGALRREADYLPAMLHILERWATGKATVYASRPGYREDWRS